MSRYAGALALTLGSIVGAQAHAGMLDYWPMQQGNYWVYHSTYSSPFKVTSGRFRDDALGGPTSDLVLLQQGNDDAGVGTGRYHFDQSLGSKTLVKSIETSEGVQVFTPPILHLPQDDAVGTQFSSAGSCGSSGGVVCTYAQTGTIAALETVSVKAGTFDALRVEYSTDITNTVGNNSVITHLDDVIWMAQGVGQVKRTLYQEQVGVPQSWMRHEIELIRSNLAPEKDEEPDCQNEEADPIHVATGNSRQSSTDYPTISRLSFERSYNSRGAARSELGYGWRHGLDHQVSMFDATSPRTAAMQRADGRVVMFTEPSLATTSAWTADDDVSDRLVARYSDTGTTTTPIGWYYYPGCTKVESYDAKGKLKSVNWASGRRTNVVYSNDRIANYTDSISGRKLSFSRADARSGLITQVKDDSGLAIALGYDGQTEDLKTVGVVGESKLTYSYNEPARTGGASLPHALTTLKGQDGFEYVKWTFDERRRATSSAMGSVVPAHEIAYTGDGVSTVKYPNGKSGTVNYATVQNVKTVTSREVPRIHEASGGIKSRFFDANRNVRQQDDFNGNRTCLKYNLARNVETVRVEGLANTVECESVLAANAVLPAGSRKISTAWHPDWRFKTRVAQPLKITSYVYNGQVDPVTLLEAGCVKPASARLVDGKVLAVVCSVVEQATQDKTGSKGLEAAPTGKVRRWSYEYDGDGQVTSAVDPVLNKTGYQYYADESYPDGKRGHSKGDLQWTTNGAGHKTTYDLYDKAGRLLQLTDANATKTELGYEAHGWVQTVLVTPAAGGGVPQLTRYDYYPTGLLKTVTTPDGMTTQMQYDDARRLTHVTDSAGNTVEFTPDEMGNARVEELKSKDGAVVRRVERIFNDLNRLKDLKLVAQPVGGQAK